MEASRIAKIGGAAFAGLVVATAAADKLPLAPLASQAASFIGAFVGTLVARRMTAESGRESATALRRAKDATTPPTTAPKRFWN